MGLAGAAVAGGVARGLADGTVAGRYRFTHALYQEVAYQRLPAARRVQLHRRIGAREEVHGQARRRRLLDHALPPVRQCGDGAAPVRGGSRW